MTWAHFSTEWCQHEINRAEVQTALYELADYIEICTEYPPHPKVSRI
ncbi:hypothetical protein SAMN05421823_104507 [Catalinimonas alkaloidigena]|uniref:Uncharacterized protein n=1 Tax=Catalinimonas alkaloidigena TaxID=1075417 RepID=A0A1G9HQK5_9BACT|nr:hypothetical protein SAMN05421823_104507 [Catalinimonas alkaloidigena]